MTLLFEAKEIARMGISIEEQGKAYYSALAQKTSDKPLKELFTFLADEEGRHIQVFENLAEKLAPGPEMTEAQWKEFSSYASSLVQSHFLAGPQKALQKANEARSASQALAFAIEFEKDTMLFFYEIREFINPEARAIVNHLIDQERDHVTKLTEMKNKLTSR